MLEIRFGENMTKREIAILSFKVLSLYAFIRVIDNLPYTLYSMYGNGAKNPIIPNILITAIPPLLLVLCSALLWYMAPFLASSVYRSATFENEPNGSLPDIQAVAFTVVGLFLLASALPEIVSLIVIYYTMWAADIGGKHALIRSIIVLLLKIGLGLWLLLGSHGLVKFIRSMQRD
jgi:hypothetical protein